MAAQTRTERKEKTSASTASKTTSSSGASGSTKKSGGAKTGAAAKGSTKKSTASASKRSGAKTSVSDERLVDFYREMLLIRRFEERASRAYTQALIGGYCHLNLGEEATVVGLMRALNDTDYLFTNYREHGYAISRGIDPKNVMAELYGRVDGTSKGWGGSMHMFDLDQRLLGGYGVVGGQLPLATGAALAIDYRKGDEVVMCTMGDGTTNIGAFHESLNIAALWDLPIVYVIINNGLGMGTTVDRSSAEPELYKRACSYRMASERIDGFDPVTVYEGAQRAIKSARNGKPFLLEVMSERLKGHSVVDPAKYRSKEEVEDLKNHDPVHQLAAKLEKNGVLDDDGLKKLDDEAKALVKEAADFAEKSPFPEVSTLFDYTYATPVANDSRRLPGDPLFAASETVSGGAR